jgi:hypothetical protein
MFERFTDRARRVLVLAQEEARLLSHSFIGTEHILLGLIAERDGIAAQALATLGISLDKVRAKVEETIIPPISGSETASPPFTPRAKKVLELSLRQALQLGHSYIGTEHILLGLHQEGEGVAMQVLGALGVNPSDVRREVIQRLGGPHEEERATSSWQATSGPNVVLQRAFAGGGVGPMGPRLASVCVLCGRDLWEVSHYVTNGAVNVCEVCISHSARRLDGAMSEERCLTLPPRVFGEVPDENAVSDIVVAATKVFEGRSDEELSDLLEDADVLRPFLYRAQQRIAGQDVTVTVRRVRFDSSDTAWMELTIRVGGGGGLQVGVEGPVQRLGGRWKVTRELMTNIIGRAGVQVPPPD